MAGYGLSRFEYRWGPWRNNDIAFWFISQRMLPPAAAILAFMVMFNFVHLLDTVAGLAIAYTGFNLPFAIWIMRDFFTALPRELEESSLVEGAKLVDDVLAYRAAALSAGSRRHWDPAFHLFLERVFLRLAPGLREGEDNAGRRSPGWPPPSVSAGG